MAAFGHWHSDGLNEVFGVLPNDAVITIAVVNPMAEVDDATEREHVRLIASAPALLEALTRALPYVETAEADEAYKPGEVAKVTAMIRAAIRQAEGGE